MKALLTKKDTVMIITCGLFLLANLGAAGRTGRRRAKKAAFAGAPGSATFWPHIPV
ncbi:MAG: hypothetical protein ACYTEQ_24360 [Planctomycetota bacterium]|jgi:hypothetical protein